MENEIIHLCSTEQCEAAARELVAGQVADIRDPMEEVLGIEQEFVRDADDGFYVDELSLEESTDDVSDGNPDDVDIDIEERRACTMCAVRPINVVLLTCGHVGMCTRYIK